MIVAVYAVVLSSMGHANRPLLAGNLFWSTLLSRLTLAFLGPSRIELDDLPVKTSRHKALALLAVLAVTGRPHSRESLATLLWTDFDAPSALAYLRRTLWEIGHMIGKDWIVADRDTLLLAPAADLWLDVAQFRNRLGQLPEEPVSVARLAELEEAVGLYRGDLLAGLRIYDAPGFESWQIQETEALRRDFKLALATLAQGQVQHRQWAAGLATAYRWLAQDEFDEAAHRQVMRTYVGLGDRAAALRHFEKCANLLAAELNLSPSFETVDLAERIRRGDDLMPGRLLATPLAAPVQFENDRPAAPRHNLPAPPTPFVGRSEELRQIDRLLATAESRLITLLGPGGSGKTRLAIQAGLTVAGDAETFPDGVWFVALAPLQDATELERAIAHSLSLTLDDVREPRQQLADALRTRRLLLILDNCEHMIPEIGNLSATILAGAPGVRLMATSRTRLNMHSEQLFAVGGLELPPAFASDVAVYDAVHLFLQAARRLQPAFSPGQSALKDIDRICRLVLGMPLGIELAASWVALLSPAEIASEIERSLDFLETGWQDAPERHSTLRAVFNSSWQMLSEEERAKLALLSVFRGAFSRAAAEAVAGATPRLLLALLHKSWLQRNAAGRYEIHELLRQYAAEKLADDPRASQAARRNHALYYADFLKRQHQAIHTDQKVALETVMAELAQIQTAWLWLVEAEEWSHLVDDMLPILFALNEAYRARHEIAHLVSAADHVLTVKAPGQFNQLAVYAAYLFLMWSRSDTPPLEFTESRQRLKQQAPSSLWYLLLVVYGAHRTGRYSDDLASLEEFVDRLRLSNDRFLLAFALGWQGDFLRHESRFSAARGALVESLEHFRSMWPHFSHVGVTRWLADVARREGDAAFALVYLNEAVRTADELDMLLPWGVLTELSQQYFDAGDVEGASRVFSRQQERAAQRGDLLGLADALGWHSIHLARYGAFERALATRQQVLELEEAASSNDTLKGWNRLEMGEIYRLTGDLRVANDWYEAALSYFDAAQSADGIAQVRRALADLALAKGEYGQALEGFGACLTRFDGRDWWQTAYAISGLGRVYLAMGEVTKALEAFLHTLNRNRTSPGLALLSIVGLAEVLEVQGELTAAIRSATFAHSQPAVWYESRNRAGAVIARVSEKLPAAQLAEAYMAASHLTLAEVLAQWAPAQSGPGVPA